MTKSPWSLVVKKSSHTFICLYLLPRREAAVTGVRGQTSPCSGPEEHSSSQMLLSCKLSAVTPLIHMTTRWSRQVLQLVYQWNLQVSSPRSSLQRHILCTESLLRFLLTATAGNAQDQQKLFSCLILCFWWQTGIGFRLLCLYYQKLFLFITSPAWLDWKPFLYELHLTYRFCSLLYLTRF